MEIVGQESPNEVDPIKQARETIEAEKRNRVAACVAAVNEVLARYHCAMDARIEFSAAGVNRFVDFRTID